MLLELQRHLLRVQPQRLPVVRLVKEDHERQPFFREALCGAYSFRCNYETWAAPYFGIFERQLSNERDAFFSEPFSEILGIFQ